MKSDSAIELRVHERVLARAERFPWNALYRIAIGYLAVALFIRWSGRDQPGWGLVFWFIGVLLGLRLLPAILRRVLPFSQELTAVWAEQRMMAKRFDSYQWQKLFWFGIGLLVYAMSSGRYGVTLSALTAFCLVSGGLGILVWRRRARTGETIGARR